MRWWWWLPGADQLSGETERRQRVLERGAELALVPVALR